MEEKLYFKPAKYGKGIKKKENPKETTDGSKDHRVRNLIFFLLFLIIIILIVLWLLHGKTTTSGQYPENIRNEALDCTSTEIPYSKITSIKSNDTELKINLIFSGSEKINTIGIRYALNFPTHINAVSAEAVSHAEFNNGLAAAGFSSEKFENKFTIIDTSLTISAHATASEINEFTKEYFMIDRNAELPTTLQEYKTYYSSLGLKCTSTLEN